MQNVPSSNPDAWRSNLAVGDEVFWSDPDRHFSSGIYRITEIVGGKVEATDTVLLINNSAGSQAEVFASELLPMQPEGLYPVFDRDSGHFDYLGKAITRLQAMEVATRTMQYEVAQLHLVDNAVMPDGSVEPRAWIAVAVGDSFSESAQLRLVLNVVYALNGVALNTLRSNLQANIERAIGGGMLTGETAAEVEEHSISVSANSVSSAKEVFAGYLQFDGAEKLDLEFEVRAGATKAEKDSAFVDALAQIARLEYLSVGEIGAVAEFDEDGAWAIRMCALTRGSGFIDLVGADMPVPIVDKPKGTWDWIDGNGRSSTRSLESKGLAAIDAIETLYPRSDWQYEVANNDTRLGYREWTEQRIESEAGVEA